MELSTLRSRLSHASNELQSLTVNDLTTCKWPIRRRICYELFCGNPFLAEYARELEEHIDRYENRINQHRQQSGSREKKLEIDQSFKTAFMRTVLDGLTKMRWPPTLEAFSDPIGALFGEKEEFYSAVNFILDEVNPSKDFEPQEIRNTLSSRPKSAASERMDNLSEPSIETSRSRPSSFRQASAGLPPSAPSHQTLGTPNRPSRSGARSSGIVQTDSIMSANDDFSEISSIRISPKAPPRGESVQITDTRQQLVSIIEKLQFQNETLSKQLKTLQLSVAARDHSEAKMSLIFMDFIAIIDEIVDLSGPLSAGGKPKSGSTGGSSVDTDHIISSEEHERFREEVRNESLNSSDSKANRGLPKSGSVVRGGRRISAGSVNGIVEKEDRTASLSQKPPRHPAESPNATDRSVSVKGGASSSIMWTKLREQVGAVYANWTQSVRDCRQAILKSVVRLPESSSQFVMGGLSRTAIGGGTVSVNSSPRSNTARNGTSQSQRSRANPNTYGVAGGDSIVRLQKQCSILTHRVLGVSVPLSWMPNSGENNSSDVGMNNDWAGRQIGLDLKRVHQLQRDLLRFADNIVSISTVDNSSGAGRANSQHQKSGTSANQLPSSSGLDDLRSLDMSLLDIDSSERRAIDQIYDSFPANTSQARRQCLQQQMILDAQDLALHLSSLAPIAPLNLADDSPLKSSMTGIEMIADEINKLSSSSSKQPTKGLIVSKLQLCCERAMAEQMACIRTLDQCRSALQQWAAHAKRTASLLVDFIAQVQHAFKDAVSAVHEKLTTLQSLIQQYTLAQHSRIVLPNETKISASDNNVASHSTLSNTPRKKGNDGNVVPPLDVLAKGYLGAEVAGLVNVLRLYCSTDIANLAVNLQDLESALQGQLQAIMKQFQSVKTNLISASDATTALVSGPVAGN